MTVSPSAHSRRIAAQQAGCVAEETALAWLVAKGLSMVARNVRCRLGEVDLIMRDGTFLVFVEVRYRRASRFGCASATVDLRKQGRIIRAARFWMMNIRGPLPPCRFDVLAIDGDQIDWLQGAFDAAGHL